ncbi:MAG TPA: YceI family protein, partial [Candidatus Polarisedimenticolia bacterium]|nr:YceI family protein [Candidatus Polarisedimenticolia bacterium]
VFAAADTYTIDPEHTNIGFKVKHFFSKVPGRFNKFEGTMTLDQADLSKATVNVSIDAASIDTNEPARDKHLRSDAFFDVEKNPKITFQSTKVRPAGPNKLQIDGNLSIRGVTKPVTLDVDVLGFGPDAWGGYRGGFEAHTQINRLDYGVSWNDVVEGGGYILGNDVEITLNIEAVKQKPKPAETPKKSAA